MSKKEKEKGYQKWGWYLIRQRGPRVQHRCVGEVGTGTEEVCDQVGEPDVAEAVACQSEAMFFWFLLLFFIM